MNGDHLTFIEWTEYRWIAFCLWLHRCPECGRRGHSPLSPRWETDRVAVMLGHHGRGRPCCGKGATS